MSTCTGTPKPGDPEYRALLEHCTTCPECMDSPHKVCLRAAVLRRKWSRAHRAGAAR